MIEPEKTKFHGETYDATVDRERLSGQLQRVFDVLSGGREYPIDELARLSGVSVISISKRASDLRIYHGYNVVARRIDKGYFAYKMLPDAPVKVARKMKPIGDEKLFGEMMRSIYAYAALEDLMNFAELQQNSTLWALDMVKRVRKSDAK